VSRRDPVVRDTKQRILDAAVEVFGERGYRGASVDDVALAAGVTKGAVYYYFTDKDDLARDLQRVLWGQLAQDALAVYDPERPAVDNLLGCFEAFLATIHSMAGARTFLREAWFMAALDSSGRADHEEALELVQGLLQAAMEGGELARLDPEALTRVLVGALMEATLHILGSGEIGPTMAVIEHLVRSLAVAPTPAVVT
jgi:AcrR family transcriptional regulator